MSARAKDYVLQAKRAGATFRLRGGRVLIEHAQLLDDALLTALRARRPEVWTFLGGAEQDAPSLALLDRLNVQAVVPQTEAEALKLLDLIEADSERTIPAGLIGFDIETQANPGEEVRRPVKISRHGQVEQQSARDPIPIRRKHKPQSSAGLDPHRSTIRLAQLYGGGDLCMVLDTRIVPLSVLMPLFQRRKLVIHNASFELAFLHAATGNSNLSEAPFPRFECTMQAAGLLYGTHRRGLDDVAHQMLGIELPKQLQTSDWSADFLSPGQIAYAALDAIVALRVWRQLRLELHAKGRGEAYLLQRDVIPAVVRMQAQGMALDRAAHRAWMDARSIALHAARTALEAATGMPPPAKPRQQIALLKQVLSSEEQAAWPRTKKTGELSTRDQDLKRIDHKSIELLRAIKSEEKALGAFGAILAARAAADGRLQCQLQRCRPHRRGHMRCTQPNLQQCPRDPAFREKCFVAGGKACADRRRWCARLRV